MAKYQPDQRVSCPYCRTTVRLEKPSQFRGGEFWTSVESAKQKFSIYYSQCPECLRFVMAADEIGPDPSTGRATAVAEYLLWPKTISRDPLPSEVPSHIAEDYIQAALVLPLSPKASAALSRRCLQAVLRESAHTKAKDLSDQIEEVLPTLPTNVAQNLDAIRAVGNFAAHPSKSKVTGEIIEVELGEAEWNLDVLDSLFDFYYVRPVLEQKKREAINQKLMDAGKPPLKR